MTNDIRSQAVADYVAAVIATGAAEAAAAAARARSRALAGTLSHAEIDEARRYLAASLRGPCGHAAPPGAWQAADGACPRCGVPAAWASLTPVAEAR